MLDRRWSAALSVAAYAALARLARPPVPSAEDATARAVNHDRVGHAWLWPSQQLGTPWVLPGTAAAALATGRHRLALAAALALPLEKASEVATKKVMFRPRPALTVPEVCLRDDAPVQGSSFPSGHTAIAACAAALAWPHLGPVVRTLTALGVASNGYARVHQGAHFPVDVVGGVALGVGLGSALSAVVDPPRGLGDLLP